MVRVSDYGQPFNSPNIANPMTTPGSVTVGGTGKNGVGVTIIACDQLNNGGFHLVSLRTENHLVFGAAFF